MNYMNTPTVSAPTISSSSMLVELGISTWTARKKDRSATADVLSQNYASKSAGNFNKNLMDGCAETGGQSRSSRPTHARFTTT